MMITTSSSFITCLLSIEPEFKDDYESYLKFVQDEVTSYGIATTFSDFVARKLKESEYKNAVAVFNMIEILLSGNNSDENIKNAICTCFLENLLNRFTEEHKILDKFIPLLGPESIKYCKSWDEFSGVKTAGLWGSENPNFKSKNKLSDEEALAIIKVIKNREYQNEVEVDTKIKFLEMNIPGISNLLFYDQRNLNPEQILEEAKKKFK